jgi:hypothetical protein
MKSFLVLGCCLATAVISLGSPPASVEGMKFRHNVPLGLGTNPFDYNGTEILLNSNGSYTGLRSFVWRQVFMPGGAGGGILTSDLVEISIPPNGTWSYRVIDQSTAEIIIDGRSQVLHFDVDKTSGVVGESIAGRFNQIFWLDPYNATTRLVNCSTRTYVAPGRSVSFGFVVSEGERRVLVRAIGPGLSRFGITQPLENPQLEVHLSNRLLPVDFDLPESSRATLDLAAQRAGTFPLPAANDQGKYLTLTQGAYIAEVRAPNAQAAGDVLIEVYQLP